MRVLDGEQLLTRIFIGESEKWHHTPLFMALPERLRREGFAGTTVFRGLIGFGASSVIHSAHILDISTDLPVLIEIVEDQEHTDKLVRILDEMVTGGALITMERVRVIRYAAGRRGATAPPPPPSSVPGGSSSP